MAATDIFGSRAYSLARSIQSALLGLGFRNGGVKSTDFYILRETRAPQVLIEIGFIDNSGDNNLFVSKRKEIVKALAGAILVEVGRVTAQD